MNSYCLFACSDRIHVKNSIIDFVRVVQDFSRSIDSPLTHIDYSFAEDEDSNRISSNESYLNAETLGRLTMSLEKKRISELVLWSAHDNVGKSPYQGFYAEIRDAGPRYDFESITISFPMELIEGRSMTRVFSLTYQLLKSLNHLGKLDYALLTSIDSSLIATYFRGVFTPNLSEEQALDIAVWEQKFMERKRLLRGLYWGNLLSANHLMSIHNKRDFLDHLEDSVQGLHTTINGDDLFFMLPTTDTKSDPVAKSVETLLLEYNLLMHPGDDIKQVLRRLISR